jgi:hypothetical protein
MTRAFVHVSHLLISVAKVILFFKNRFTIVFFLQVQTHVKKMVITLVGLFLHESTDNLFLKKIHRHAAYTGDSGYGENAGNGL